MSVSNSIKFGISAFLLCATVGAVAMRRVALIQEFSLKDEKGANGFSFAMTGGLEPIHGYGNDISGTVMLDLDNPNKSTGRIDIGVASLKLSSELMTKNMGGEWCLDTAGHPTATFVVESCKVKKGANNSMSGTATGKFTLKGVTKAITVPISARYVKGGVKARFGQGEGDLLMLSSKFTFKRFDYNVGKTLEKALLSDEVDVSINLAAMAFTKTN